ncbi:MAG: hypothetical protein WKF94_03140 [Solirubrobacteraceae bacterium]
MHVVVESRRLYRVCRAREDAAFGNAFCSNYELDRDPRGPERVATVIHMALSTFDTLELAVQLARALPKIGSHVAALELVGGRGLCVAKTGRPGHWSVWGRPEQLLGCVVDVVEIPG